jgi:hypothetical protein
VPKEDFLPIANAKNIFHISLKLPPSFSGEQDEWTTIGNES